MLSTGANDPSKSNEGSMSYKGAGSDNDSKGERTTNALRALTIRIENQKRAQAGLSVSPRKKSSVVRHAPKDFIKINKD